MIAYSHKVSTRNTRDYLRQLRSLTGADLLIAFGQFESAVVDALCPDQDDTTPAIRALHYASFLNARAWMGLSRPALAPLSDLNLPESIAIELPPGFSWHALFPEQYAEAARQFLVEVAPSRTVVIGLRSAGAAACAVVAAALDPAFSFTAGTRGPKTAPYVAFSKELEERVTMQKGAHYIVVGEAREDASAGFVAVARALERLGIPADHIEFMPGVLPSSVDSTVDPAFYSYRSWTADFDDVVLPKLGDVHEIGRGRWRELVYGDASWPACQVNEERRKYLRDGRTLLKFVGLGERVKSRLKHAGLLSDLGFTPEVLGAHNGFIAMRWENAKPLLGEQHCSGQTQPALIEAVSGYLTFLSRCAQTTGRVRLDELLEMIEKNCGWSPRVDRGLLEDAPLVCIDGKMQREEWLSSARGIIKADAFDHHDDFLFPGTQDIAWDYAAANVELGISPECLTGDTNLLARINFYRLAYSAFRFGYCRLNAEKLKTEADGARFSAACKHYLEEISRCKPV